MARNTLTVGFMEERSCLAALIEASERTADVGAVPHALGLMDGSIAIARDPQGAVLGLFEGEVDP